MKTPPHESPLHAAGLLQAERPALAYDHPALRPAGISKRVFAWMLSHSASPYERQVEPHKRRLLGGLAGSVVEIGPGAGANLRYYAADARLLGLEPNPHFHPYLRAEAERLGRQIEIRRGVAERLEVDDSSVDAVVSTLVLCSVEDLPGTLAEIRRVLKPGGRFAFIEHVAAPRGSNLRRWQERLTPYWQKLGDGCRLDRETWAAVERAGFADVKLEHFRPRIPVPLVAPHIAGFAVKN